METRGPTVIRGEADCWPVLRELMAAYDGVSLAYRGDVTTAEFVTASKRMEAAARAARALLDQHGERNSNG